jgi:hypothetical protein
LTSVRCILYLRVDHHLQIRATYASRYHRGKGKSRVVTSLIHLIPEKANGGTATRVMDFTDKLVVAPVTVYFPNRLERSHVILVSVLGVKEASFRASQATGRSVPRITDSVSPVRERVSRVSVTADHHVARVGRVRGKHERLSTDSVRRAKIQVRRVQAQRVVSADHVLSLVESVRRAERRVVVAAESHAHEQEQVPQHDFTGDAKLKCLKEDATSAEGPATSATEIGTQSTSNTILYHPTQNKNAENIMTGERAWIYVT